MKNLKVWILMFFFCWGVFFPRIHAENTISTNQESHLTWGYDSNVEFKESGSLKASPIAASVSGSVSLTFSNEASIESGLTTMFEMQSSSYWKALASEILKSHIHAMSNNDSSAIGICLVEEPSLSLFKNGNYPYVITANYTSSSHAGAAAVIGNSITASGQNGKASLIKTKVNLSGGTEGKVNTLVAHGGAVSVSGDGTTFYGSATVVVGASLNTLYNSSTANTDAGAVVNNTSIGINDPQWTIGDYNALIAYSEGPKAGTIDKYFGSSATVLGASCVSSFNQSNDDNSNKCQAEMSNIRLSIGNYNRMEAYAGGYCTPFNSSDHYYGATASVIGASCSLGGGGGSGPATMINTFLTIGDFNNFTAYGSAASTILGASCDSVHKGSAAIVNNGGDSGSSIQWEIGNNNHFKSYSGFSATVLGASCNSGGHNNKDEAVVFDVVWSVGNSNIFEAYSGSSSAVLGSAYKSGNSYGLAGVGIYDSSEGRENNNTLSASPNGVIWSIGNDNTFLSAANGSAVVFGSSVNDSGNQTGGAHARVANAIWNMGQGNTLAVSVHYISDNDPAYLLYETLPQNTNASHPYAVASVLGASCDSTNGYAETSDLILVMDNGNFLTASASTGTAASNPVASANVIGAATRSGQSIARNTTVVMNGSQTLAAVAYSSGTTTVNAFGADNTDKGEGGSAFGWRVGIGARSSSPLSESPLNDLLKPVTVDSTVNIFAARLGSDWAITDGTAIAT
ncbi:MAG: hypothetical protein LBD34_02660, partial [Puniceicoccales bacterium]|nr:hypothetical protein [Puniceicoccales bacterium]